jgi:hypothetical protein
VPRILPASALQTALAALRRSRHAASPQSPNCCTHSRPHNATEQLLTCVLCSLKVGRVVIITRGRYAGKKCVIISPLDNGTKSHPFPHALVAGIERYPSKVTRRMSKNKQAKKSKVKPFVKQVNCTWSREAVPEDPC